VENIHMRGSSGARRDHSELGQTPTPPAPWSINAFYNILLLSLLSHFIVDVTLLLCWWTASCCCWVSLIDRSHLSSVLNEHLSFRHFFIDFSHRRRYPAICIVSFTSRLRS
jgi:hypothetical protein